MQRARGRRPSRQHVKASPLPETPPTHSSRTSILPPRPTRLIGREQELAEISRLLLRDNVRLLTLAGPPGVGKTRLAIEAAHELVSSFEHGMFFVDLAPIREPSLVISAIGQVLGLREAARVPLPEQLKRHLRDRRLLLILDNFEQVGEAAAIVASLLTACAALRILVTSRISLRVPWEHEFLVKPMGLPNLASLPALPEFARIPVVALFAARARAVTPPFVLSDENIRPVAEICVGLDGLPLAIELAAARMRILTATQIAARLGDRFRLLTGGPTPLPRHQTLQAAIDWSYNLLTDRERMLLLRLSVFVGSAPLAAVEAVCAGEGATEEEVLDLLLSLRDKSLISSDTTGEEARYSMLETIRQYAHERFAASANARAVRDRHLHWFLALVERAEPEIYGPHQREWLAQLESERTNIRAAFDWAIDTQDADAALRIAAALARPGFIHGQFSQVGEFLDRALAQTTSLTRARLKAQTRRADLAWHQGDVHLAIALAEDALHHARELGDMNLIGETLFSLGIGFDAAGDAKRAVEAWEEALQVSRRVGDRGLEVRCLMNLARAARRRGHYARAQRLASESLHLARGLGDRWLISMVSRVLAMVHLAQGKPAEALTLLVEGLLAARDLGDKSVVGYTLASLAESAWTAGQATEAATLLGAAEAMRRTLGLEAAPSQPAYAARYRRLLRGVRETLGKDAFDQARARGAAQSLDEVVEFAMHTAEAMTQSPAARFTRPRDLLSTREREVALQIARGLSTREIAKTLFIGERTVETHVVHILNKLGLTSRTQIAAWAATQGLD